MSMDYVNMFLTDEDRELTMVTGQLLKVLIQEEAECRTACSALLMALTLTFKEDTLFSKDEFLRFVEHGWAATRAEMPIPTTELIAMSDHLKKIEKD